MPAWSVGAGATLPHSLSILGCSIATPGAVPPVSWMSTASTVPGPFTITMAVLAGKASKRGSAVVCGHPARRRIDWSELSPGVVWSKKLNVVFQGIGAETSSVSPSV